MAETAGGAEFATARDILFALARHANDQVATDPAQAANRDEYARRARALHPDDRADIDHVLTVDVLDYQRLPDDYDVL